MFPISDDNPTIRTPWMTYALAAATMAVWVLAQGAGFDQRLLTSVCNYGLVPAELTGLKPLGFAVPFGQGMSCLVDNEAINWLTPVTTIFLHGGWSPVLGNMWFFWVFGNNIEDSMGPGRFLAFYLLCGVLAAIAHIASNPGSAIPTVGASGAVSGVMGAYLVLYPRARVNLLFWFLFFIRVIPVPAWGALLWWFTWQVISALPALQGAAEGGGVAFAAHVGGFVAGLALIRLFTNPRLLEMRRRIHAERYPHIVS